MAAMPGKLVYCQSLSLVSICRQPLHIEEDSCSFCHALAQPTWSMVRSVWTVQCGIEAYLPGVLEIELSL